MTLVRAFALLVLLAGFAASPAPSAERLPYDAPDISFLDSDRTSLTLQVHAGQTGAPAGFVVQWLPVGTYESFGGWPEPPYASDSHFSGVPTLYVTPGTPSYQLQPDQSVNIVLGKLFDETGVISSYASQELADGTDYVVRVQAAASATTAASPFSQTIYCATRARTSTDCTVTLGFWKSHAEAWDRVASIRLGTVTYTNAQLHAILNTPAKGNGLITLAHQLITAKLNALLGATPGPVTEAVVAQADAAIGARVVPPVGQGYLAPSSVAAMAFALDAFNTGKVGPGHCPSDMTVVGTVPTTWGRLKTIYR
jgi:hypothetical protein